MIILNCREWVPHSPHHRSRFGRKEAAGVVHDALTMSRVLEEHGVLGRVKKSIRKILRKNSAGVGGYNEEIFAEEILIQNGIHGQIGNFVFGRSVLVMREHVASLCIDGELRRMRSTFMSLGNCLRSQEIKGLHQFLQGR